MWRMAGVGLIGLCLLASCDPGVQRGNYVVGGSGGFALAESRGWVCAFSGTPAKDLSAPNRVLLAVVFIGNDFRDGMHSNDRDCSSVHIESPAGDFDVIWNRISELVDIRDSEFRRTDGNVFLVRMEKGKLSVHQMDSSIDIIVEDDLQTAAETVLAVLKKELPNDSEVQALAPYPLN